MVARWDSNWISLSITIPAINKSLFYLPGRKGKRNLSVIELKKAVCEPFSGIKKAVIYPRNALSKWTLCAFGFSEQVSFRNETSEQALASCIASLIPCVKPLSLNRKRKAFKKLIEDSWESDTVSTDELCLFFQKQNNRPGLNDWRAYLASWQTSFSELTINYLVLPVLGKILSLTSPLPFD